MRKMFGVTTPIVTHFTADDKIDFAAMEKLILFLIDKGVDGIYVNGSTGEMSRMTVEERKAAAEFAVKTVNGAIGVFIQCGAPNTSQTIELARHALEIGADGIGVVTPQYMGVNDREMTEFYVEVAQSLPEDFPVYLYNIPQCAANDITPAVVDAVAARCKNVLGLKYSKGDMDRFREYVDCKGGSFDVIAGPDRLMFPALAIGCCGVVAGCSQADPTPFVNCYRACMAGDMEAARQASREINELCDIVHCGGDLAYLKTSLEAWGLPGSDPRKPGLPLIESEREILLANMKAYLEKYSRI